MDREKIFDTKEVQERAIMVLVLNGQELWSEEALLLELGELCKTAGLLVVGTLLQKRSQPDSALFIGKGKLEELRLLCEQEEADCVIFDHALSPSQLNNLQQHLPCKVLDKPALILDIFAQRAQSREGKLQVELAQANYLLPRLMGQGLALSRQGGASKGGVGTRGPGETKLESDRRYIRQRIQIIKQELEEVRKHRAVQQKRKLKNEIPLVALVGYTNAGKSSLLNCLADDTIYAENQLFATLDTTTRTVLLPDGSKCLLTDTVGFIHDLPPQLINAFKATLDELQYADLLLHVIDLSNPNYERQIETVEEILKQLQVDDKKQLFVFNKIDRLEELPPLSAGFAKEDCCYISAVQNLQIDDLLQTIQQQLNHSVTLQLELPLSAGQLLNQAYQIGKVSNLEYTEETIRFQLYANQADLPQQLRNYEVDGARTE